MESLEVAKTCSGAKIQEEFKALKSFHRLLELPKELVVKILRYLTLNELDVAFEIWPELQVKFATITSLFIDVTILLSD